MLLLHRICKSKSNQLIILILYERQEILMKKLTLVASLVLGLNIAMGASANDGTVTFTGKVVDQTCTVKTESQNLQVKLPTVSKKQLDTANKTAGKTAFNIKVENCSVTSGADASKVAAYFLPNAEYIDENTHNLKNTATSSQANNVQVRLLNNTFQPIQVGENIDTQYPTISAFSTINAGTASIRYYAEYIAIGSATPGNVTAKVEYDIVYK